MWVWDCLCCWSGLAMCLHGRLLRQRRFLSLLSSMPNTAATSQDGYWHDAFCRHWYKRESWTSANCLCTFALHLSTCLGLATKLQAEMAQNGQHSVGPGVAFGNVKPILHGMTMLERCFQVFWHHCWNYKWQNCSDVKHKWWWGLARDGGVCDTNSGMNQTFNSGNGWEIGSISHY